jgi:trigger factor
MSLTYRGLKATLERHIVTDTEIDQQLEQIRQQNPRTVHVDNRPTQNGDEVVLDYAGFCDGVQFPGGTAENQTLVLGSGMFIPGFEEQLLGKVPGDEVLVKVTFPTEYHAPDLAGKDAEFRCKIYAVRVKETYALDDTFAKEVGGCETLAEMRALIAKSMQDYHNQKSELELQERLLRMACDSLDFTPTEHQIDVEVDVQIQNLKAQLAQQGIGFDLYLQYLHATEEQLREHSRKTAEVAVKMQATIEQIAYNENLEATDEDINQMVEVIARQNNMTVEQLQAGIDADFSVAVVRSVLTNKVMKLIRDSAEIEEI